MPLKRVLDFKSRREQRKKKEDRRLRSFHSVDWEDPEDIVEFVMGMWDTRRQRRWWLERAWYTNISFFLGHQWVEWNNSTGSLYQPKCPSYRVRITANLLQGVARKIVATVLQQKPIWTAVPATGDPADQVTARIQEKVVKYYWGGPLAGTPKLVDALNWMTTTGLGCWRLHWDPQKSSEFKLSAEDVSDESLVNDLKKLSKGGDDTMNLGDAELESKSPFQIDPDPWARSFDELQWLIDSSCRSVEWVHQRYPKTGKDVEADDTENLNFFEKRIADLSAPNQRSFTSSRTSGNSSKHQKQNMVNVHELFALPFGKFRRGLYVAVAGDTLLDVKVNQFRANGEVALPYSFYEEIKVPGRLWPTCAIEQAISLQAEYNKGRSQVVENRNLMSRPKWLVPDGAGIGDDSLTSEPGEVVTHTFGHKPEAWTPPPLPPYVLRTLELARSDIQDATGVHEVSQAKAPSGVKSGRAVLALQEQDQSILAPTMMCIEHQMNKFGSMLVELLSRKITEPRLLKIAGKNELYEVEEFSGKDLIGKSKDRPGVNYFDVRVKLGSQLPLTPDARRQAINELVQVGILNVETDRRQILELLELGSDEPLYDQNRMDKANQRKENQEMMKGELMEVQDYDDDVVHVEVMEQFQKSPEYARDRTNESIKAFNDHKRQHMENHQAKQAGTFEIVDPGEPEEGEPGAEALDPEELLLQQIAEQRLQEQAAQIQPLAGAV